MYFTKPAVLTGLLFLSTTSTAVPLTKRIAQTIADSTTKWVAACTAAGGGDKCQPASQTAFMSLLAGAGDCDQQNAADGLVDLAKTLGNDAHMIALAQVFMQQSRNSPNKLSVRYCQQAPRNAELKGLFQCQFEGVDSSKFTGGVGVGAPGTVPFGMSAPVSPPGSCKAHPQGGITDGSQLVDLTEDPGVVGSGAGNSTGTANVSPPPSHSAASAPPPAHSCAAPAPSASPGAGTPSPAPQPSGASTGSGFHLKNGQDAQAANAKFATLSPSSACTDGEQACVSGGFAQCVGGKFAVTQCAGGTSCFALPLVNKPGTSIACTTSGDATARIAATGANGGLTGSQ